MVVLLTTHGRRVETPCELIASGPMKSPCDVAVDKCDNMFVADSAGQCIHGFTKDGVLFGTWRGDLEEPVSITLFTRHDKESCQQILDLRLAQFLWFCLVHGRGIFFRRLLGIRWPKHHMMRLSFILWRIKTNSGAHTCSCDRCVAVADVGAHCISVLTLTRTPRPPHKELVCVSECRMIEV